MARSVNQPWQGRDGRIVAKAGVIPADNTRLGIPERQYVTNADKSKTLGDALDGLRDEHVQMSLQLQEPVR